MVGRRQQQSKSYFGRCHLANGELGAEGWRLNYQVANRNRQTDNGLDLRFFLRLICTKNHYTSVNYVTYSVNKTMSFELLHSPFRMHVVIFLFAYFAIRLHIGIQKCFSFSQIKTFAQAAAQW